MSDVELTRRIREMFKMHREKRKPLTRSTFPSREWLAAQQRLVELQKRFRATNDKPKGGCMTSKLGVYWSVMHRRSQDYAYFQQLQPSVFKIMDGGPPDYQFARDNLPNSLIVARDWALSEQHADMLKDPTGTGIRHAQEWNGHQQRLGFDKAKTLILGINEPKIWEPGVSEALRLYTIALCDAATSLGLRVGAMQLSVGWPNNDGPDTPPNWSAWHGVDNAIRHNNGALVVHEYFADNGPGENWGWWAGRVLKCPWQVSIVIGECGIDMFVKDSSVGQQARGWRGHKSPEQYAAELADYVSRMSADDRFMGCCTFTCDFAAHEWASFDVEHAYQAILATPIQQPPTTPDDGGDTVHIPSVGTGAPYTMYVSVPAGANLRDHPVTGKVLVTVPFAKSVKVLGIDKDTGWKRVLGLGKEGFMAPMLLSAREPEREEPTPSTPAPQPTNDCWERALAFVLEWEGGWADDPNDPGGATMKGITLETYTKWLREHRRSAPSKEELKNITNNEVREIYFHWYWLASGSDKLPFPLCLAHFNIAVNGGPARAEQFLAESGGNFKRYMAAAMEWYTRIDGWKYYGAAWTRRNAALLREASK